MKRPHRRAHLLLWLIFGPVALATVVISATMLQPSDAVVDALPSVLEEAR